MCEWPRRWSGHNRNWKRIERDRKLNLHGTAFTSASNCRACSGVSFTPSSITYSNVTKSGGAR